jgi:hypothetical protein
MTPVSLIRRSFVVAIAATVLVPSLSFAQAKWPPETS